MVKLSTVLPSSSEELPKVVYNGTTYYFDTLIGCGDTYAYDSGQFKPLDNNGNTSAVTFGSLLLEKVKNSITINAFTRCVSNLPEYLTQDITIYSDSNYSDKYTAPDLTVNGRLFIEKLNEYMKSYGDSIISKYEECKFVINTSSGINSGTLTIKKP